MAEQRDQVAEGRRLLADMLAERDRLLRAIADGVSLQGSSDCARWAWTQWLDRKGAALLNIAEAAADVWETVPASWDDDDDMVPIHARALNTMRAALVRLEKTDG